MAKRFPYNNDVLCQAIIEDYLAGKTYKEIILTHLKPLGFNSWVIISKVLTKYGIEKKKGGGYQCSSFDYEAAFKKKLVPQDDCLIYTGPMETKGRFVGEGGVKINHDEILMHHRAALHFAGIEVPKGMHVHHKCFNHLCCNVDHLEILTPEAHKAIHAKVNPFPEVLLIENN